MGKIKRELASHTQRIPNEAAAGENGVDIPEVFILLPLSRKPMTARIIKVQPAPCVYVADDAPLADNAERRLV